MSENAHLQVEDYTNDCGITAASFSSWTMERFNQAAVMAVGQLKDNISPVVVKEEGGGEEEEVVNGEV